MRSAAFPHRTRGRRARIAGAVAVLLLLVLMGDTGAEDEMVRAAEPERDRPLSWIFDTVCVPGGIPVEEPRTLIFVLDATPAVIEAEAAAELVASLERHADHLRTTRIGVRRADGDREVSFSPRGDTAGLASAVREALSVPTNEVVNVYAPLRAVAKALRRETGRKEVLLLTLDNGDAEDDVEATVEALAKSGVAVSVVTREAFLSDTFWLRRARWVKDRGLEMRGSEGAFIEVPWGWLFQSGTGQSESIPSGFAMFGLRRLAAGTGGRVYFRASASSVGHACGNWCPFCDGDHLPQHERYRVSRLRPLAPPAADRAASFALAAGDPYFRAVLAAWKAASKEGVVSSRPAVELAGRTLRPASRPIGQAAGLLDDLRVNRSAGKAERLARACGKLAQDLGRTLDGTGPNEGHPRYRAVAAYTRLLLRLTRLNLLYFKAWCREVAPGRLAGRAAHGDPPDVPMRTRDAPIARIVCTPLSLCHGVRPFFELRLPGGDALSEELAALADEAEAFLERYDHTPFGLAFRRSGIARFRLLPAGTGDGPERPAPTSGRPQRGPTTDDGGVGPTTGSGR